MAGRMELRWLRRGLSPRPTIARVVLGLVLAGCVSYQVTMTIVQPATEASQIPDPMEPELIKAVERTVRELGFRPRRLPPPEMLSSLEEDDPDHLLASFVADADRRTHGTVAVSVLRRNTDGRLSVLILDFDSFGATDYTTRVEQSLQETLQLVFPVAPIEIQQRHVFPALGP